MELDKFHEADKIINELDGLNYAIGFVNRLRKEHKEVYNISIDDTHLFGRIPEEVFQELLDILEKYYNDKAKELELKFQEL